MRRLVIARAGIRRSLIASALLALLAPSALWAQSKPVAVDVRILVIEAFQDGEGIDPRIPENVRTHLGRTKYARAAVLDSLGATVEAQSSVSLEVRGTGSKTEKGSARDEKPWLLKVKVLDVKAQQVKLRVAIDAVKFAATTTHKNGGTIVLAHDIAPGRALYLAVTPKM